MIGPCFSGCAENSPRAQSLLCLVPDSSGTRQPNTSHKIRAIRLAQAVIINHSTYHIVVEVCPRSGITQLYTKIPRQQGQLYFRYDICHCRELLHHQIVAHTTKLSPKERNFFFHQRRELSLDAYYQRITNKANVKGS